MARTLSCLLLSNSPKHRIIKMLTLSHQLGITVITTAPRKTPGGIYLREFCGAGVQILGAILGHGVVPGVQILGFAETRFGAHGRFFGQGFKQVNHHGLKTPHRGVFACRTDIGPPVRPPCYTAPKRKGRFMRPSFLRKGD